MYSKIQRQCLNELGIQGFELKPEFSLLKKSIHSSGEQEPQEQALSWNELPSSLLDDLRILLPDIKVHQCYAEFNVDSQIIKWTQAEHISQPNFIHNNLYTPDLTKMCNTQKRSVWYLLQSLFMELN